MVRDNDDRPHIEDQATMWGSVENDVGNLERLMQHMLGIESLGFN